MEAVVEKQEKPYKYPTDPIGRVIMAYKLLKGFEPDDRGWDKRNWARFARSGKGGKGAPAYELLEIFNNDWEKAVHYMELFVKDYNKKGLSFTMETIVNNYDEWRSEHGTNKNRYSEV